MDFFFTNSLPLLLAQSTTPEGYSGSLQKVWNFFYTGGWYMFPILLCSFVGVTVVIYKCFDLSRKAILPDELATKLEQVEELAAEGRLTEISRSLRANDSTMAKICRHALLSTHASREDAERSTEALAREEVSRLERGIPLLEVIFTIAPLLGLIGTVTGLVTIFGSFGTKAPGPEQAQMIAKGISEALNTTIAGLAVAVPAYIFQSFFSRKLEGLALRMSTLTTGLISAAYRTDVDELPPPPPVAPTTKKSEVVVIHPEPETVKGDPASA